MHRFHDPFDIYAFRRRFTRTPDYAVAGYQRTDGTANIAAVNVGTHPTAPGGPPTIEANLLDYDGGALYDRHMRLLLCSFVRSEKKFDSLEQLRAEVMKNREQVRAYFERDF